MIEKKTITFIALETCNYAEHRMMMKDSLGMQIDLKISFFWSQLKPTT